MLTHVGINFFSDNVLLYNIDDKSIIMVDGAWKNNIRKIDKIDVMLNSIKLKIGDEFGCISILLPVNYGNAIRKKIINSCYTYGFKEVEMLDVHSARYIDAIFQSGWKTNSGDVLWLFEGCSCYVWKKIKNKAALLYRTQQNILEKKNLDEIRNQSKQIENPKYILCNLRLDKSLLKSISPDADIFYYKNKTWNYSVIIKARIMAGDPEVVDYDTNPVGASFMIAKIGEKRIMSFYSEIPLPSTKAIHLKRDNTENVLSILTAKDKKEDTELPHIHEFVLTVTVDVTGIYAVHYHQPSINKDVLENLYSKAENYSFDKNLQYFIPLSKNAYSNEFDVVGIDLGASRCCVAVNRKLGIETISLDNTGERHLPSYIALEEKHDKCGQIVINRLRNYADSAVFDTKLIIGKKYDEIIKDDNWPFKLIQINNQPKQLKDHTFATEDYYTMIQLQSCDGEVLKYPEEISSILLKYIKQKAEEFQGRKLYEAVITVPTLFNDTQKKATYVAASLAGWKDIVLLPEPIAAIFGYSKDMIIENGLKAVVFDLGGNTLNIYIIKIENNKIIIEAQCTNLANVGKNFDNILENYFSHKFHDEYNISDLGDKKYKFIFECQRIKEDLSTMNEAMIDVEEFETSKEGYITITRKEFELLASEILAGIKTTVVEAVEKSNFQSNQIDKIFQVGGGCRMPIIKNLLHDIFPNAEHCCDKHPEEIVAIGAAYYAYNKNKDKTSVHIDCHFDVTNDTFVDSVGSLVEHPISSSVAITSSNAAPSNIKPLKSNLTIKKIDRSKPKNF